MTAVLETQELLKKSNNFKVKIGLLNGNNGVPKLSADELAFIQEFGVPVPSPKRRTVKVGTAM